MLTNMYTHRRAKMCENDFIHVYMHVCVHLYICTLTYIRFTLDMYVSVCMWSSFYSFMCAERMYVIDMSLLSK